MEASSMLAMGYMAKQVAEHPAWLAPAGVTAIYSLSNHISKDFADYIDYWKHNNF